MRSAVRACLHRLGQYLSRTNTRRAWAGRGGLALGLAAAVAAWWGGDRLTTAEQLLLAGVCLSAVALRFRRGFGTWLGPLVPFDLARTARRSRFVLHRIYSYFLLLVLGLLYFSWAVRRSGAEVRVREVARFAMLFVNSFLVVQLLAVAVLTPAFTAGAIAEEKESRTLEFLLATDLRNREIVLGKLLTRLANLALLILTGLPILCLFQFFGGVDPNLVLAGYAVTGLTLLSLAGLSILCSVYAHRSRDAIMLTYLAAAGYLIASSLCPLAQGTRVAGWFLPFPADGITVGDVLEWFAGGNVFLLLYRLAGWVRAGGANLTLLVPGLLRDFALFHGPAALLCVCWAVARLRKTAARQAQVGGSRAAPRRRPPVGARPLVWKEVLVEPGLRFNAFGRVVVGLLVLASFLPAANLLVHALREEEVPWGELADGMNQWARLVGAGASCLLLLGVAVRAAGSISGERDRQTLDSLLTTPVDSDAILWGKWLGSVLSVRRGWLWLGLIWALALATDALSVWALPLLVLAWLVYAATLAGVGLWFSTVSRNTGRATVWTLVATLGLTMGHWGVWCFWFPIADRGIIPYALVELAQEFEVGLTPPLVFGWLLPWSGEAWTPSGRPDLTARHVVVALLGLACWAAVAVSLWVVTSARLRRLTGRAPLERPEAPRAGREQERLIPSLGAEASPR
jgi:ABC-type transport system involved in multi-copper enzyme maturation permease subunit